MKCDSCSKAIDDDASYCKFCGARQPRLTEEWERAGREVVAATAAVLERLVESAKPVAQGLARGGERVAREAEGVGRRVAGPAAKNVEPAVARAKRSAKGVARRSARITAESARKVKERAKGQIPHPPENP